MIEEEKFFAWLDGELTPEEAARVEAEIALDPELLRQADEHRAMTSGLRNAFGSVEMQPVPERLKEAARGARDAEIVDIAKARAGRAVRKAAPLWAQAAALAATLTIGVFAGNILSGGMGSGSPSPIEAEAGRLVASADLERALYSRLASAPTGNGPRIGLTFRDKAGAICRTFEDQSSSGLACREGGDWRIRSVFQASEGQSAEYRMATVPDPQLMETVDATIDGAPFDAKQEKAAMERGWR
jgi:hypothetical protein